MTNNTKGFEIATDIRRHLLRVTLWGFWDVELAKKYKYALRGKIKEIKANGKEWHALMDFREFLPRSEEVQQMMNDQMVSARKEGMKKIGYLGERSMIQLQLNRVFQEEELRMSAFFKSEQEAIRWLLKDHPPKSRSP